MAKEIYLTPNEITAKALVIGRTLERMEWWKMKGKQAEKWAINEAKRRKYPVKYRVTIARMAMQYVIAGK